MKGIWHIIIILLVVVGIIAVWHRFFPGFPA